MDQTGTVFITSRLSVYLIKTDSLLEGCSFVIEFTRAIWLPKVHVPET